MSMSLENYILYTKYKLSSLDLPLVTLSVSKVIQILCYTSYSTKLHKTFIRFPILKKVQHFSFNCAGRRRRKNTRRLYSEVRSHGEDETKREREGKKD